MLISSYHIVWAVSVQESAGTIGQKCVCAPTTSETRADFRPCSVIVCPADLGQLQRLFTLTARRVKSRRLRINGKKARFKRGNFSLETSAVEALANEMPGSSISFWLFT